MSFKGMVFVSKYMIAAGAPTTVMDAFVVLPVPPFVELTVALLVFSPIVIPVTLIENVQELSAARVALLKLTVLVAWVAVIVPLPQSPDNPFGVATTNPKGRLSVNDTPVRSVLVFGLVMVKVSVVVPFWGMVAAPKDLEMLGGFTVAEGFRETNERDTSVLLDNVTCGRVVPAVINIFEATPDHQPEILFSPCSVYDSVSLKRDWLLDQV